MRRLFIKNTKYLNCNKRPFFVASLPFLPPPLFRFGKLGFILGGSSVAHTSKPRRQGTARHTVRTARQQ